MEIRECFLVLGLDPVKDERQIKNAYREKLAVTNPEDDQEGFMRLRTAYEEACRYAKSPDEAAGENVPKDLTPSGLWVERAAQIYARLSTRCQLSLWEELFQDDIFQSLEEEENCRFKLLRFIMDHFRLPSAVWKLFDRKMNLSGDAARLRENFPADFINFVLNRCERGEDIEFDQFEGADDADYDLFIGYYDNCWQALQEENLKEAEKLLEEASGLSIYHPAMEVCRGHLYFAQDKKQEAADFFRALCRKYPEDDMVCYHTAEILWKLDARDEAAGIYLKLKEKNEKHYMANVRLTEWYYDKAEYTEAKKCAEAVLSSGADDSFMELLTKVNSMLEEDLWKRWKGEKDWEAGLELCWCCLQDGATSRGIRLARDIRKYVSEEKQTEYTGLLAKLYVEEAEYEQAVCMADVWEEKLKQKLLHEENEEEKSKDEDRVRQAYMIRMQSYRNLGYKDKTFFEKAVAQIEAVETGTPKDIGLLLEKSQILMEMEEYEKSLDITSKLIEEYQIYAAAANAMEVYRRQWIAGGVVQNARICIQKFPSYIRAYEHLARVFLDLNEREELEKVFEEAEKNEIKSPYLDAYRYQVNHQVPSVEVLNKKLDEFEKEIQEKLEDGQMAFFEVGLSRINEYMNWYPGAYMLRRRASFYKAAQKYAEALADYEKALAEEPGNASIYANMGSIYTLQGDHEKALFYMKKAILYSQGEEWANILYLHLAKIYMRLNDNEQALFWFEHYDKLAGSDKGHFRNMAECLARLGQLEEAKQKLYIYYRKSDSQFYDGYYQNLIDIYGIAEAYSEEEQLLAEWKNEKKIGNAGKFDQFLTSVGLSRPDREVIDYYNCAAWREMRQGNGALAVTIFKKKYYLERKLHGDNTDQGLIDLVFAAILFGDDAVGREYAKKLQAFLDQQTMKPVEEYYNMPKIKLTYRFLAKYYVASVEELQDILDQEGSCANCDFCLMPLCKELEAMRFLLLLRQGKFEEARERVQKNLEVQPYDDYLQIIKNFLDRDK